MTDENLTTTELQARRDQADRARQQKRDRALISRYGCCTVCSAPRDISTSTPKQMRIRCSANPAHEVLLK